MGNVVVVLDHNDFVQVTADPDMGRAVRNSGVDHAGGPCLSDHVREHVKAMSDILAQAKI